MVLDIRNNANLSDKLFKADDKINKDKIIATMIHKTNI